ncbi:MAG: hypothetical protein KM296_06150 [Brockia lithotrophica]|nr:hypothetical protein [Brockia lithotrophica]
MARSAAFRISPAQGVAQLVERGVYFLAQGGDPLLDVRARKRLHDLLRRRPILLVEKDLTLVSADFRYPHDFSVLDVLNHEDFLAVVLDRRVSPMAHDEVTKSLGRALLGKLDAAGDEAQLSVAATKHELDDLLALDPENPVVSPLDLLHPNPAVPQILQETVHLVFGHPELDVARFQEERRHRALPLPGLCSANSNICRRVALLYHREQPMRKT